MAHTQSALKRAFITALTAVALMLGIFAPAQAHDQLVSTSPKTDESLTEAPEEVVMTFSGHITQVEGGNQVRVVDAEGNDVTRGAVEVNGTHVTQPISGHGSDDETYTVTWRVVSQDGHPVQGQFQLTVGEGKEVSTPVATSEETDSAKDSSSAEAEGTNVQKLALFAGAAALMVVVLVVVLKARPRK